MSRYADSKGEINLVTPIDILAKKSRIDSVKLLRREQMIALMRQKQGDLTGTEFAKKLGISGSFLTEIYKGRRDPGEAILSQLGLSKRVLYEKTA